MEDLQITELAVKIAIEFGLQSEPDNINKIERIIADNISIPMDAEVKPACDWLTTRELKILESELRVIDPTVNKFLTVEQEEKLFDEYNNLVDKLAEEILRRENRKSV